MLTTKRKPATVGEILVEEFMQPMGLIQAAAAKAMGVQRKHLNELCNDRRNVMAATALILARVLPRFSASGSQLTMLSLRKRCVDYCLFHGGDYCRLPRRHRRCAPRLVRARLSGANRGEPRSFNVLGRPARFHLVLDPRANAE